MAREVAAAVEVFRQMGHAVEVIEDKVPETGQVWMTLGAVSGYAMLGEVIEKRREEFGRAYATGILAAANVGWKRIGQALRTKCEFNRWVQGIFERFDLLLTPTLPTEAFNAAGPPPKEIDGRPLGDLLDVVVFTYPFNLSGHPAASVRAGLTDNGLPCGLQIVAERHRDDLVLQAAWAYEQARPWNRWPDI